MAKKTNPFTGRWRITSMSDWKDYYLDEEVEAFIEFDEERCGSFHFGYVRGLIDHYRTKIRDGTPAIQFTWYGDSADGTPLEGIGWAVLKGDKLRGMLSVYLGDDCEFVAKQITEKKATKRK